MWSKSKTQSSPLVIPPGLKATKLFTGRDGLGFPFVTIWDPKHQTATIVLRAENPSVSLVELSRWETQAARVENLVYLQTGIDAHETRIAVTFHAETRPERKDPSEFVARLAGIIPRLHECTDAIFETTPLASDELTMVLQDRLFGDLIEWPSFDIPVVEQNSTRLWLAQQHCVVFETGFAPAMETLIELVRQREFSTCAHFARIYRPNQEDAQSGRSCGLLCLFAPEEHKVEAITDVVFDELNAQQRVHMHRMYGRAFPAWMESLCVGVGCWNHSQSIGM